MLRIIIKLEDSSNELISGFSLAMMEDEEAERILKSKKGMKYVQFVEFIERQALMHRRYINETSLEELQKRGLI